jgi:5'-nucleotidase
MKILLTNDDGILAEGIRFLKNDLSEEGHDVLVVAPDVERSATGHAITIRTPLWVKKVDLDGTFFGYATSGTPADCVKLGLLELSEGGVDLVVSGINKGANMGTDVLYSGTVSGAMEAAITGYPAIAISSVDFAQPRFETAAQFFVRFLREFDIHRIPPYGALNINVPSIPTPQLLGYRFTRQSKRKFEDYFEGRKDPYGNVYYWLMGGVVENDPDADADYLAVNQGYVSISPLTVFHTDHKLLDQLQKE